MRIINLEENYEEAIKAAAEMIKRGGLVVFPSDTVYILAVNPTNQEAVNKLLGFKNRWTGKAISIAVNGKKMAQTYVELSKSAEDIYKTLLPGPFTVVSGGKHKVAKGIEAENGTLGIRIPDYQAIIDLIEAAGSPITATSANLSGRTPNYSIESFLRPLSLKKKEVVDLIIDGGKLPKNKPSTVIDATETEIKILRRGDLISGIGKTLISKSERETEKIAEFLLKKVLKRAQDKAIVFALSGDLGSGKTVFSKAIGKYLGVEDKITSPTFLIWNEYDISNQSAANSYQLNKFLHFDLYRISNKYEFEEIKFLDQFKAGTVACIEWVENMGNDYLNELKRNSILVPVTFTYLDPTTRECQFRL